MTTWNKIAKPVNGVTTTTNPGNPIGLLLALTYSTTNTIFTSSWNKLTKASGTSWNPTTKATGTSWTNITKAT